MKRRFRAIAFVSLVASIARAEIRLPQMLSDHAVLQRERPIHVWGWATPGAHITAYFHGQSVAGVTDKLGKWSLYLAPEAAGGPYDLALSGDGAPVIRKDVLVGDVWFASGQSNMEMPLAGFPPTAVVKDAQAEIAAATNPRLRLLVVDHKSSDYPLNDIGANWTLCTPETAKRFSAVAYFFGREIAADRKVPLGLIDSTWGGTPADSWTSLDAFGEDPSLLPAIASRATFANRLADVDAQIAAEKVEDEEAKASGEAVPSHPWHPYETSWIPAGLYNGMIAPFTPMTLKGFLWYQGETNSAHDRAPYYGRLFAAMITDWRGHFAQGRLPFLYVQISSFSSPGEDWGTVRDQQRRVLAEANTAMVVTLDVGQADNVHPPDKQTVAKRLALAARGLVYGEPVEYQGPEFREATPEFGSDNLTRMRVWFDHAEGLSTRGGGVLTGFELASADGQFSVASARVDGGSILVESATVPQPKFVRYGWSGVVRESFYNRFGLPASTFSSERDSAH